MRTSIRLLLVEYNRDITIQKHGTAIGQRVWKDARERTFLHGRERKATQAAIIKLQSVQTDAERQPFYATLGAVALPYLGAADPTPNKMYMMWLIRMYVSGSVKLEDMNRHESLTKYHRLKVHKKIKPEHADINRFKTYTQFEDVVEDYPDVEVELTDRGDYVEIHNDSTCRVIHPTNEAAACFWGQGTKWCTAATKGHNMFQGYAEEGQLFIFIPKQPKHAGEKYQLWVPERYAPHYSQNDTPMQFMDEQDREASLFDLRDRMEEGLWAVVSHVNEQDYYPFGYHIALMDDDTDHNGERMAEITEAVREEAGAVFDAVFADGEDDAPSDEERTRLSQVLDSVLDLSMTDIQTYARNRKPSRSYWGGYGNVDIEAMRLGTADVNTVLPHIYAQVWEARANEALDTSSASSRRTSAIVTSIASIIRLS